MGACAPARTGPVQRVAIATWLACGCASEPPKILLSDLPKLDGRPGVIDDGVSAEPDASLQPAAAGSNPDLCEVVHLTANPQTPDVLIVLDRSTSMADGGRWQPSVSAVQRITRDLEDDIRFGLALFPGDGRTDAGVFDQFNNCLRSGNLSTCLGGLCTPGRIVVPVGPRNAGAITDVLRTTRANGSTPTADTLDNLVDSFATADLVPDAEIHAKYVLLVTDGAPTCPAGGGLATTQPDIDASNTAIEALLAHDVRTYVLGYDTTGPGNEPIEAVLDGFAQRGGTGDQKHHPVEDEASLVDTLRSITSDIESCSFNLDQPPARPNYVLVTLDGQQIDLDSDDGWHMTDDRTIELQGKACAQWRNGSHSLTAEVRCAIVEPT